MTDKELRRLRRGILLQMLLERTEENERLCAALKEANARLDERKIAVSQAGTLAEAALSINGMLTAADESAKQYLENIRRTSESCNAIKESAKHEADSVVFEAKMQANEIIHEAQAQAEKIIQEAKAQSSAIRRSSQGNNNSNNDAISSQELKQRFNVAFEQMKRRNK